MRADPDLALTLILPLHVFEVFCTRELFDLAKWTGDDYYHHKALEHMAYSLQHLGRADGQYNGFRGAASEQIYWFDSASFGQDTHAVETPGVGCGWDPGEAHYQKGHICGFSTIWCVNVMIFAAEAMLRRGPADSRLSGAAAMKGRK